MFNSGLKQKTTKATLMKVCKHSPVPKDVEPKPKKVDKKKEVPEKESYKVPRGQPAREQLLCKNGAEAVEKLRKFGVAILPGFLTPPQCATAFQAVMRDLEQLIPTFKYADTKTWPNLRRDGKALHTMLIQNWGVAWMQSMVDIRQDPRITDFFAEVFSAYNPKRTAAQGPFKREDMLMSSDALSLHLNVSSCPHGWHRPGHHWLHTDKASNDFTTYVQGFISLTDFRTKGISRGSCLHVFLYSQLYTTTEEYLKRFPWTAGAQFNLIRTQAQIDYLLAKGCEVAFIDARKGDMVIFLSQTVHEALPAERPPHCDTEEAVRCERLVIYVACQPIQMATCKDLKRKLDAYEKLSTTGHQAAVNVKTFAQCPRTYGKEDAFVVKPVAKHPTLNEQGRRQWGIPQSFVPSR